MGGPDGDLRTVFRHVHDPGHGALRRRTAARGNGADYTDLTIVKSGAKTGERRDDAHLQTCGIRFTRSGSGRKLDHLDAEAVTGQDRSFTRPLCPYPKLAQYDGAGAQDDEASFGCAAP